MRVSRTLPNVPVVVASSCASDSCAHASSKRRFAQRLYVKKSGSPVVIAMISFHDRKSFLDCVDTNRTRQARTTSSVDRFERNGFSAARVFGAYFSLHFVVPVWVKERTQQGRRESRSKAVPKMPEKQRRWKK